MLRLFLIKVSVRSYSAKEWSEPVRGSETYRARAINSRVSYSRLPWAEQRMWHGSEAYVE